MSRIVTTICSLLFAAVLGIFAPSLAHAQEMKSHQKALYDRAAKSLYQGETVAGWGKDHYGKAKEYLESAEADLAELKKTLPNHPAVLDLQSRADALRVLVTKPAEPAKPAEDPNKPAQPANQGQQPNPGGAPKAPDAAEIAFRIEIIRTDMKISERVFQTWIETAGNPDLPKIFPVEAGYTKIEGMQAQWTAQTQPAIWFLRDSMIQMAVLKTLAPEDKSVAALAEEIRLLAEKVLYSAARARAPKAPLSGVEKQLAEAEFGGAGEVLSKAENSINEYKACVDKANAAKHDWQKRDAMGLAETYKNEAYALLKQVRSGNLVKIMERTPDDPRAGELKSRLYSLYARADVLERSLCVFGPAQIAEARQILINGLKQYEARKACKSASDLDACLAAMNEVMRGRDIAKYCVGVSAELPALLKDFESAAEEIRAAVAAAAVPLIAENAAKGDVREAEAVLKALAMADPAVFREKSRLSTDAAAGRSDTLAMLNALDKRLRERVEKASAAAAARGFDAFVAKQAVVKPDRKAILADFASLKGKVLVSSFEDLLFDAEGWYLEHGADVFDYQFSDEALKRTKDLIDGQDKIYGGFHKTIVDKMGQKNMAYLWKFPKFIDVTFVAKIDGKGSFTPKKNVYNDAGEVIGQVDGDPVEIVVLKIVAVKSRYLTFWPEGTDTIKEIDTSGMLDGILK